MPPQTRALFTYSSAPIDHWDGWIPLSEFTRQLVGLELARQAPFNLHEFMALVLEAAHAVATREGYYWEGDVRKCFDATGTEGYDEHMYAALPSGVFPRSLAEVAIAWKQDNNGSTYFASRRPLAISDDDSYDASAPKL